MVSKMVLVPREATEDMCREAKYSPVTTEDQAAADYRAMLIMSPNVGKVSREQFLEAVYANCSAASAFGCGCVCIGAPPCEWHIEQTRAVIAALGLEIEE